MAPPLAFVSYSHDSESHKAWVRRLAEDLRANGVDTRLDQWDLSLGEDIAAFMSRGIADAERVLLVCSESYVSKAEAGTGGVGYERLIITEELIRNIDTKKFIPVVRNNLGAYKYPRFLGPRLYIDFSDDSKYQATLETLLREILGAPATTKPPVGPNPFSGAAPASVVFTRNAGPTGVTPSGAAVLNDDWFAANLFNATNGLGKQGLAGLMEVRFALHDGIAKSQLELLTAVRSSEIRTFGWPIAVVIDGRDDWRPRPVADGIRAELAVDKDQFMGRKSYDYWSLRNNGDFFLLQSLFEDQRTDGAVFFDTRIVRVTEALLFASNLYQNLGVAPESHLSVRVSHRGLAGRLLTSAGGNRHVWPRKTLENESTAQIVESVGSIRQNLVDDVRRLLAPMFMLFEFAEFTEPVYSDIVRKFEKGVVA